MRRLSSTSAIDSSPASGAVVPKNSLGASTNFHRSDVYHVLTKPELRLLASTPG
jgi:hypothetical protein